MSDATNPETLDLVGVLSGRDYPELEVPVYFNEALGFSIQQMREMLSQLQILGRHEEYEKVNAELEQLVEKAREERFVVTIKAVPEKVYREIMKKVRKDHPDDTDLLGRPKPNPDGDLAFVRELWRAYLVKVTGPSGNSTGVGEAEVESLLSDAPAPVQEAINAGIADLRTGSKAGFEYAAKEVDFLSSASPEG